MLDIIYGSRLYKGSSKKDSIVAAMNSPINAELVQQLSKYVDVGETEEKTKDTETSEELDDVSEEFDSLSEDLGSEETQTEDSDATLESIESLSEEANEDESSESEDLGEQTLSVESLDAEVPGVARIFEKGNETWISYNDDTNLNNIMWDVVEAVSKLSSETLKFNRLARTENAIVFVPEEDSQEGQDESGTNF